MKTFVLVSCVKSKLPCAAKAKDLYVSPLFKLNLAYAMKLKPDSIFILSAKHGILNLDDIIAPYNETLNTMPIDQRKRWARQVLEQLNQKCDFRADRFIFLAGKRYRENLEGHFAFCDAPLRGLSFGKQLKRLGEILRESDLS